MPLTSEQRETLNRRREQILREIEELASGRHDPTHLDKTERRQELLDELDDVRRGLGEIEPEE